MASCRDSSCWMYSGVAGQCSRMFRPCVKCLMASTFAERSAGPLASAQPGEHGRLHQARLGVVVCQQFGLGVCDLRELGFQDLGNALMVLLPGASQQGLIGGILHQGMLKEVGCLGGNPAGRAVRPLQAAPARVAMWPRPVGPRPGGPRMQTPARTAPSCATSLTEASRSSRAIRASCKVVGIARGSSGPVST